MAGEESAAEQSPQPAVNNFVVAKIAPSLGWPERFILGYPIHWFSRAGGSGLLTTSRFNDFELMDRPPAGT